MQEKEKAERERQQAIEREQLQAIQLPSHAQWGSSNHSELPSYRADYV